MKYSQIDIWKKILFSFYIGVGPELTTENILQSISAALHLSNSPVTGQTTSKAVLYKNMGVNIDINQPHIHVSNIIEI